jgi:catechol 2,3-dioxygenase-like lactoylglutathione lyase family enzyme
MGVTDLNHFLVRANDLEKTREFYCSVLGFEVMPRPDFPFPGYWLGVNGRIQVHLAQHGVPHSDLYYLGSPPDAAKDQAGVIDHIAFGAEDPAGVVGRLKANAVAFRPRYFPEFKLYQLFLTDPNGLMIELNFYNVDTDPGWGGEDYSKMPRVAAGTGVAS